MNMMPPTSRKSSPSVSLFDVFVGKGRTIRGSSVPGFPILSHGSDTKKAASHSNKASDGKRVDSRDKIKDDGKKSEVKKDDVQDTNNDTWTPAQDAKLLEMKRDNKSWKDIEAEIGKPRHIAQPRFKELEGKSQGPHQGNDKGSGEGEKGAAKKGDDEKKDNSEKNQGKQTKKQKQEEHEKKRLEKKREWEQKRTESNNTQQDTIQPAEQDKNKIKAKEDQGKATASKSTTRAHMGYFEDEYFPATDLEVLARIVANEDDDAGRWDRVAARMFDLTGMSIDAEDLQVRFEQER